MTTRLVRELSEAKRWPEQFKKNLKRVCISAARQRKQTRGSRLLKSGQESWYKIWDVNGDGSTLNPRMLFQKVADRPAEWLTLKDSLE